MPGSRFAKPKPPTTHDLSLLSAMIDKAMAAANKPEGDPGPLMRAGNRAFKARLPLGQAVRTSPFLALVSLARNWWSLPTRDRVLRASELAAHAQACRQILDAAEAGSANGVRAGRDPRKDIFG